MYKRLLSMICILCLVLCLLPKTRVDAAFENTYTLTGNQRKDILGVAVTQLGYREGPHGKEENGNDTKYGDWYGFPYNEWCAMFVSWCARQADISTQILRNSARVGTDRDHFNIACYKGTEYTPQPGDLYMKPDFSHVGLVYEVRGDIVVTIEGNVNYEGVSEKDGFTVAFLERKISESVFGVPNYEGCDTCPVTGSDHQYTRKHDAGHPHANYFQCDACSDYYYTGTSAHVTDCASCMGCGCSTAYAGLYKVVGVGNYTVLRESHSPYSEFMSIADLDQVVEVLAGNGSWAHVVDGPYVYYGSMDHLRRYVPAPGNLQTDAQVYRYGESVQLSWEPARTATAYAMTVTQGGVQVLSRTYGAQYSDVLEDLQPGTYEVAVTASYGETVSEPAVAGFRILALYDVQYDCREGINGPEPAVKVEDQPLTLSELVPEKAGYRFLGWNTDPAAVFASYQPGQAWTQNAGATMYAIWQQETAVPERLQILSPAKTSLYFVGDALDTTGLELMLYYSDGSAVPVTDGYEVSGFSSQVAGDITVTITVAGITAEYSVAVVDYLPGDVDKSREINKEDVMQLLWHISFPELFPIEVPADFTGDGAVNKDDVMQLLWHISFPELFPLM